MKTKLILALVICLLTGISTYGFAEEQKKIIKSYSANSSTHLKIENKFGNVDVLNWKKDSVHIEVTIKVEMNNSRQERERLSEITVDFNTYNNTIEAKTVFLKEHVSTSWLGKHDINIDYRIHCPKGIFLDLHNKYGNVFINKHDGRVHAEVKYGQFKANELTRGNVKPLNNLSLGYGNLILGRAQWLNMSIKYSDIDIDYIQATVIESKYSKFNIRDVSSIVSESKYDTYKIGSISNLVTEAGYGNFHIEELDEKFVCESAYTNAHIRSLKSGFENIDIESKYGTFKFGVDEEISFYIDAYSKYCNISYPSPNKVSYEKDGTETEVEGLIGNNERTGSKVKIETKYGDVRFYKK